MKKIITIVLSSLCFTSFAFAKEYQCTSNTPAWKTGSIETSGDASVTITFDDDSLLTIPLFTVDGNEDNFTASGRIKHQQINLSVRKASW